MGVRKARNRALVAANPVGLPALDTSKLGPVQEPSVQAPSIPVEVPTALDLEREKIKAIFTAAPANAEAAKAKAKAESEQWHRDRANFAKAMEAERERQRIERERASSGQIIPRPIGH